MSTLDVMFAELALGFVEETVVYVNSEGYVTPRRKRRTIDSGRQSVTANGRKRLTGLAEFKTSNRKPDAWLRISQPFLHLQPTVNSEWSVSRFRQGFDS